MSLPTPPVPLPSATARGPTLSEIVAASGDAWPERALPWYRCAVEALVRFQQTPAAEPSPGHCDAAMLRDMLVPYITRYLEGHKGLQLDAGQRKTLDEAFARIVEHTLSVPAVRLHGRFTSDRLVACEPVVSGDSGSPRLVWPDPADALLGPVTWDIASLARDPSISGDEPFVLDVTIRYWERARAAGLPVDADFGAFYRAVEWTGLQQQLTQLGHTAAGASSALIAAIHATTSRYIELRPLQRFVERVEGLQVAGAYVMGRG